MLEVRKLHDNEQETAADFIEAGGEFFRPPFEDMGGIVWGAFKDGELVGAAWLGTIGKFGIIEYLYVVPEMRQQGVAKTILANAQAECEATGVNRVQFQIHVNNMPSVKLSTAFNPMFSGPYVSGLVRLKE